MRISRFELTWTFSDPQATRRQSNLMTAVRRVAPPPRSPRDIVLEAAEARNRQVGRELDRIPVACAWFLNRPPLLAFQFTPYRTK
jgi:hypothetical protein